MIQVTIDPNAGFCFGVRRAVSKIETLLSSDKEQRFYCLGELVHNQEETERLQKLGLETVEHTHIDLVQNTNLIIRAHGEPPATFEKLAGNNNRVIDLTCPVVKKLQERVRQAYLNNLGAQIVIVGKKGHPEVVGLNGQTNNSAIVVSSPEEVENLLDSEKPIILFAQTTISRDLFNSVVKKIRQFSKNPNFCFYETLCRKVSDREQEVKQFARQFDVVVFVSGKNSSNGNFLFNVARSVNPNTYFVSTVSEIMPQWFSDGMNIGVSGATSTPQWLLNDVASAIRSLFP